MHALIKEVTKEVENRKHEIVDVCSKLIRIPTVNPPGKTKDAVEFIESYFEDINVKTKVHERTEGKTNICVSIPSCRKGKILWLGHLDVVSEGDRQMWNHDPYGGEVIGEKIFGRGASDMKGSCASAMVAAKVLSTVNPRNICESEFWFTCDEETNSVNGVKWLTERDKLSGNVCIIGDSEGITLESPFIDIGCKGGFSVIISAKGTAAHSSMPFMGENAIERVISAIETVKKIEEFPLGISECLEPVIKSSIEFLKNDTTLNEKQRTDLEKLFHYPTASLSIIKGGVKINIVPEKAEAIFDIRVTPSADLQSVNEEIVNKLRNRDIKGVELRTGYSLNGYYEDPNSKPVIQFMDTVRTITGGKPKLKLLSAGTDAIFLKERVDIPCIGFGAGAQGMFHANDEYVTAANLLIAAKVYSVFPLIYNI